MPDQRIYLHSLDDMLSHVRKARMFAGELAKEEFLVDEKTGFAIIRALEVIGEAAKNVPIEVQQRYPQIPWREITRMRDKLIHHYFGVNMQVVWKTVSEDLPRLESNLVQLLRQERPE